MNDLTIVPMPFDQQVKLAEAFAKSKMFGVTTAEQALALMALCEAEGLHPATAVRDYHIIQNRPAMKAEAMLARFLRAGGTVEWHERTDQAADATFSHPSGGKVRVNWTILQAKVAGLVGKDVWKSYPRAMLSARCVSEGVRAVFPQATGHQYTPDEVDTIQGQVINGVAEVEDNARRDEYVQKFRDALDADTDEDETARALYALQHSLHEQHDYIELNKSIWTQIHSKDRSAIKDYVKKGKVLANQNGDHAGPRQAQVPPIESPDHKDFMKEYDNA